MLSKKYVFLVIPVILFAFLFYGCSLGKNEIKVEEKSRETGKKEVETSNVIVNDEETFKNDLSDNKFKEIRDKSEVSLSSDGTDENPENFLIDIGNIRLSPEEEKIIGDTIKNEMVRKQYDFPIIVNTPVKQYIEAYTTIKKRRIQLALIRSKKYISMIKKTFKKYGLPEDLAYLPIIESGFRIKAVSRAKAKGIWQFMRGTAKKFGLKVNFWVDERYDPEKSTLAAAKYLKLLYKKYNDWYLALAAYNAGEGKISRAIRRAKTKDYWELRRTRYIRRETKGYVPAFIAALLIAKEPGTYGFSTTSEYPQKYKTVLIPSPVDLRVVAKKVGISYLKLKEFNPELIRGITPAYSKYYELKVPEDTSEEKIKILSKLPVSSRIYAFVHTVRRGESLYSIARRYGTSIYAIKSINRLRSNLIHPGRKLIIPKLKVRRIVRNERKLNIIKSKNYKWHRVTRGETLYRISRMYNVDINSLKRWNKLRSNLIRTGDLLIIYVN